MFRSYLHGRPIIGNINYRKLSELTSTGYISSDIRLICDEAATRAFCEDIKISQELIEQVIRDGGPSINKHELKTYEEARKYMEPVLQGAQDVNYIGLR